MEVLAEIMRSLPKDAVVEQVTRDENAKAVRFDFDRTVYECNPVVEIRIRLPPCEVSFNLYGDPTPPPPSPPLTRTTNPTEN